MVLPPRRRIEERQRIRGGAGEARQHAAIAEAAQLLGVGFEHGLAEGDLAVPGDHHLAVLAQAQDGRAVPGQIARLGH